MAAKGALMQGITGSLGACVAATCTYPIEIVRTRIQAGKANGHTGFLAVCLYVLKKEGISGLYSGLSSQYIQTSLGNFLFFYFYSTFRKLAIQYLIKRSQDRVVKSEDSEEVVVERTGLPVTVNLLVGIVAAICQVLLMTPINVSLTRIKTNSPPASTNNRNLVRVLVQIAKQEGIQKLYAGIGPALILTINPGLEFAFMERLRDLYIEKSGENTIGSMATFFISALAKMGATIATYPYILAKVRMQNSGETSVLSLAATMFKETGILGFYAGMQIQLLKSISFASVRNIMKELIIAFL